MIGLILLAAAVASPPSQGRAASRPALVQATATVRIVQGERVVAGHVPETAMVTNTRVRGSDGVLRDARLIQFP